MSIRTVQHKRLNKPAIVLAATMALFVAFCMTIGPCAPAFAFNDGGQAAPGSITLHKYKSDGDSNTAGTGASGQTPSGTALPGAQFTLYKLDTTKVEGGDGTTPATGAPTQADVKTFTGTYGGVVQGTENTTTDATGTISWTGLALGYYLLVENETTAQTLGVKVSAPSIVTVPYYNGAAHTYNKDVVVYPKDATNSKVEKTLDSSTHDGYVAEGDSMTYKINFSLGATTSTQLKNAAGAYMSAAITDTPQSVADSTGNKHSVLSGLTAVSADIIQSDGQVTNWTTANMAKYFTASSVADGTTVDPSTTWTLTNDGVDALLTTWGADDTNPVTRIVMHVQGTVTSYVTQLATQEGLNNAASVTSKDSDKKTLLDGDGDESDPTPTGAFSFSKLQLSTTDDTAASSLTGVTTWQVASSYANANAKQYLKDGTSDLVWTSQNGKITIGGLTSATLMDNGVAYSAVKTAFDNAKATPNTAQTVDLWLEEKSAPTDFKLLQAPLKVTMSITYNSTTKAYSVTSSGGNVPASATTTAQQVVTTQGTQFGVMNYKDGQTGPGSFQLPNTGGAGTLFMIVGGIVLIIVAGGYFARRHSKQRQSKIL